MVGPPQAAAPGVQCSVTGIPTSSNQITKTKLAGATQRTFTYRTGGDLAIDNPAGSSAFNYTYNAARRLSGVSKGSTAKGAYGYDFAGRRVWRQTFGSGAAQTAYVFDTDGHVLAEENAVSGAMTKEYVWLDDALVGMFIVQSGGTVARFVTTGQIDEPLVITQPNKNVAWSGYTDPYGNQGTLSGSASLLDLRLPGQWYEAEGNASGLHQNGYRDYDPSLGRYIEADPLGVDAGANLYGYVDGDPVDDIDPSGQSTLIFDRNAGSLTFFGIGPYGWIVFVCDASNHPQDPRRHPESRPPYTAGVYDYKGWSPKPVDPNGSYGSHGVLHFPRTDCPGCEVHAGRANKGGPHGTYTNGCIRTTDDCLAKILDASKLDPINNLIVR